MSPCVADQMEQLANEKQIWAKFGRIDRQTSNVE